MTRHTTRLHTIALSLILLPFALTGCNDDDNGNSQRRVTGTCAAGTSITEINEDGTVECGATGSGDITDVTTNGGLVGGAASGSVALTTDPAVLQRRVSGVCPGNTFATAVNADGTMACAPGGDITSIATGASLTGGGTSGDVTLSVANGGINTVHLANDSVTTAKAFLPTGGAAAALPDGGSMVFPTSFTAVDTTGSCVVTASAITYGNSATPGFRVRPVVNYVTTNQSFTTPEWSYSHLFSVSGLVGEPLAPSGTLEGLEATSTSSLNVASIGTWRVGCEIQGNQTGIRCRVSYQCT